MPSVRLSPELEYFLVKLKEKYRIEETDFAKLLFLLDEWAVELRMENVKSGLQLASRPVEALKAR